jgi:hypothetical protein
MSDTKYTFLIYYRELPIILDNYIKANHFVTIIKDGIKKGAGHPCPRLTLTLERTTDLQDQQNYCALVDLLDELVKNNQLVDYSIL